MDTEEVEVQSSGKDERMNPFFPNASLPQFDHLSHRLRCFFRAHSFETTAAAAIGEGLNDVNIAFLYSPASQISRKCVKLLDRGFGDRKLRAALVN